MNTMTTAEAMAMFAAMPDTDKAAYDEILTAGQPIWVPQAVPLPWWSRISFMAIPMR